MRTWSRLCLVSLLPTVLVIAAPRPETAPPGPAWLNGLERPHRTVSGGIAATVERIDRLFGDERYDDEAAETQLRVKTSLTHTRDDAWSFATSVRARLELPRLQRRLQLVIDDDYDEDDVPSRRSVGDALRDSRPDAALRFLFDESARHRTSVDAGLRLSGPRQAFTRWRGRWVFAPGEWDLRLVQTFAWFTATGAAESTEMRWTRALPRRWWFRAVSRTDWEEEISGVTAHQAFDLGRELSARRAYRWQLSGTWPELPHPAETIYRLEFTYRQRLHRDWLYGELAPQMSWARHRDYATNPGISLRLETLFGDAWRRAPATE